MENKLQLFHNEEFTVRAVEIDGKPWFVGKDVAANLKYANTRKAIRDNVDEEDTIRGELAVTPSFTDDRGCEQYPTLINESGVYSLILRSKMPKAKQFKHWLTSEVIPSIRKHGMYATPDTITALLQKPESLIEILTALKNEQEKNRELSHTVAYQKQEIDSLRPKSDYVDTVLQCTDLMTVSQIAKDFGLSANALNKILHDQHVQYKCDGAWLLYQQYANEGYVQSKTYTYYDYSNRPHVNIQTHWTQKGRLFIYNTLKSIGILPIMERERA